MLQNGTDEPLCTLYQTLAHIVINQCANIQISKLLIVKVFLTCGIQSKQNPLHGCLWF